MEQLKIILFLLVWPEGQAENNPLWSTGPFLTMTECEASADALTAIMKIRHGVATRTKGQCVSLDNRLKE